MPKNPLVILATAALVGAAALSTTFAEPRESGAARGPAAAQPAGEWATTPVRSTTAQAITYLFTQYETTMEQMDRVGPEIDELLATVRQNQIDVQGQVIFIYEGMQQDPTKPFKLSIGMPVPRGTPAVGKYQVKDLPPFKCAGLIFQGSIADVPNAYQKLFGEVMAGGTQRPTDEIREIYLYWESSESDHNVVWIQVGVQ
jgi:effector-binding domain-containing protein